ncbi:Ring canal kelch protein, putative [Brugia malayi]|uniref:BMA-KEL-1 n=1 Tax=Brugia malayi TaxID=6279 RepID=A0A0K0J7K9_BRUMA|nr:Ring canal kelch protein, putative [Brugia malayi]CTP80868.1 BMA-KEL-1 [Brugia malayi]VIO90663.1 Ring canal kelch protein, putative [Brugia malayi]
MERWRAESESTEVVIGTLESETHFCTSPSSLARHFNSKQSSTVYNNDNFPSNVLRSLNTFRKDERFCDVILMASLKPEDGAESDGSRDVKIVAHRAVLAAGCPYFSAMFSGAMKESKQENIFLKGIDGTSLLALIDYMYSGRLTINEQNVQSLLTTGSLLQMACVRDACSRFLLEQLDPSNCLGIANFAVAHGCTQLAHAATTFVQQHFNHVVKCDEFLALSKHQVVEIISSDHLTTTGEDKVYEAVVRWVMHDILNRRDAFPDLMAHVRLPLLPRDYLTDKVDPDILVRQSSECKDYLLEAYRYHLKDERGEENERSRPRQPIPLSKLIMLIGGQAPKAIANVDVFDLDALRWMPLNALPQRRCRCGVGELKDFVYAVGGFNGSLRVKSVDAYDVHTDRWFAAPPMDARRSTLGVAVIDQLLIAVGGFDGSTGLSSAEAFDPRNGQWMPLPSMTVRRSSVGVTALNGMVYAVGGYDGNTRNCLDTVEIYEPRVNRWRSGPTLISKRSGAGVTVVGDRLVAVGGHDGPVVRETAEILNGDSWTLLPEMNVCRRNASAVALDSNLFAIGGDDGTSNLSSIEVLNISSLEQQPWTHLSVSINQPRSYAGVALLPKVA